MNVNQYIFLVCCLLSMIIYFFSHSFLIFISIKIVKEKKSYREIIH